MRPNRGPLPWWMLRPGPPRARHHARRLSGARCRCCGRRPDRRVDQVIALRGPALGAADASRSCWRRSTPTPESGSAELAGAVIRETLAQGRRAPIAPRIAAPDPGRRLRRSGPGLSGRPRRERAAGPAAARRSSRRRPRRRPRRLRRRRSTLGAGRRGDPGDAALGRAQDLLPGPGRARRLPRHRQRPLPDRRRRPGAPPMIGVIGGTAEWMFAFDGPHLGDRQRRRPPGRHDRARTLAAQLWADVAAGLRPRRAELPPWQIVKEQRATFAATPEQDAGARGARTRWRNLVAGRRLDRDRPARHHRRRAALRPQGRRAGPAP